MISLFFNIAGAPHCIQNTSWLEDVHSVLLSAGQTGPGVKTLEETVVGGEELVGDGKVDIERLSEPDPTETIREAESEPISETIVLFGPFKMQFAPIVLSMKVTPRQVVGPPEERMLYKSQRSIQDARLG